MDGGMDGGLGVGMDGFNGTCFFGFGRRLRLGFGCLGVLMSCLSCDNLIWRRLCWERVFFAIGVVVGKEEMVCLEEPVCCGAVAVWETYVRRSQSINESFLGTADLTGDATHKSHVLSERLLLAVVLDRMLECDVDKCWVGELDNNESNKACVFAVGWDEAVVEGC